MLAAIPLPFLLVLAVSLVTIFLLRRGGKSISLFWFLLILTNLIGLTYFSHQYPFLTDLRRFVLILGVIAYAIYLMALQKIRLLQKSSQILGLVSTYLAWVGFGCLTGVNFMKSGSYFLWLLTAIVAIFVLTPAITKNLEPVKGILRAVLLANSAMILVSLGGILGFQPMIWPRGEMFALRGIFATTTYLGIVSLVVVFLGGALRACSSGEKLKYAYTFMFIISAVTLALSHARGSWIATIAGLAVYLVYKNKRAWRFASFAILIFVIIACLSPQWIEQAFRLKSSLKYGIFGERTLLYQYALASLRYIPLTGLGLGNQEALYVASKASLPSAFPIAMEGFSFHNSYIEAIVELGFIGLLLLLLPVGITFLRTNRFLRNPYLCREVKDLSIGLLALTVALAVNGFFESTLILPGSPSFFVFWLIITLLNLLPYAAARRQEKEEVG
jgi:O-antigen ligase